ncbi:hypothetical protein IMZ48_20815 [Candidatus Bathyarchaeota archaeon]|nr:hypothetical protein [Candidatus Bathyarchaeota archaeon]
MLVPTGWRSEREEQRESEDAPAGRKRAEKGGGEAWRVWRVWGGCDRSDGDGLGQGSIPFLARACAQGSTRRGAREVHLGVDATCAVMFVSSGAKHEALETDSMLEAPRGCHSVAKHHHPRVVSAPHPRSAVGSNVLANTSVASWSWWGPGDDAKCPLQFD